MPPQNKKPKTRTKTTPTPTRPETARTKTTKTAKTTETKPDPPPSARPKARAAPGPATNPPAPAVETPSAGGDTKPAEPPPVLVPELPDGLTEPWMRRWAEAAAASGNVEDACVKAGVTYSAYAAARRRDATFDDLCRVHDQVLDLRIADSLRAHALKKGDARHQSLYFNRVRALLLPDPDAASADDLISSAMAEAMVRAGLLAGATRPATARPSLSPSRPKPPPCRDSDDNPE
jgi:hypothetical protein